MDPTACLHEIRELVKKLRALQAEESTAWRRGIPEEIADVADQLADYQEALDDWLSRGGFMPNQWNARPAAAPEPRST
jgi:DNA-binding transcriptional MerR regulator